jgi:signal transduction histidine kinase
MALEDLTRDLDRKVRDQTEQLRARNRELSDAYDELKNAQAQLIQSEKMASLGQLVAGVAHELNNPASFVHGALANIEDYAQRFTAMIEAYERVPIADPEARRRIDEMRRQTRLDYLMRETPDLLRIAAEGTLRIKQIVDDLRVFARADHGDRAPVDLRRGIDGTIRLLGNRIHAANISMTTDLQPGISLYASAGQLNQVWMNLLGNAIDAVEGRPDPAIHVFARVLPATDPDAGGGDGHPGFAELRISDNGVGIDPEAQKRVFEPFFTTKPSGKGTGLGLSIVYGAIKSHAGAIDLTSEPGRGTTITVRLPLARR